ATSVRRRRRDAITDRQYEVIGHRGGDVDVVEAEGRRSLGSDRRRGGGEHDVDVSNPAAHARHPALPSMRMPPASTSLDRYDTIGVGYRSNRRPDPRVAAHIDAALGDAERILDIGAGTGSYEPADRFVVAVDASAVM